MDNDALLAKVHELEQRISKLEAKRSNLTMVLFSGDFDRVMAAFIIANSALAMGKNVTMFVTFWGLDILKKSVIKTEGKNFFEKMIIWMRPKGPKKLSTSKMNFGGIGPMLFQYIMKKRNVQSPKDMIESSLQLGLKVIACQMTMDIMGIKKEDLIDNVEFGGAATFLSNSFNSGTTLFI